MAKGIEIEPAVTALREWGQTAFDAVLRGSPVPALSRRGLTVLRPWLHPPEGEEAGPELTRRMTALFRHRGVPGELSPLQTQVLQAAAQAEESGQGGTVTPLYQPILDRLVNTLAAAAWTDPGLQLHIAERARSFLRSRILFTAARPPLVSLSAPVFWCLIACQAKPRWGAGGGSADWDRLQAVATRLAMQPGSLRYWDQWVLVLWLRRHRHGRSAMSAAIAQSLMILPILREPEADEIVAWLRVRTEKRRRGESVAGGGTHLADSHEVSPDWSRQALLRGTFAPSNGERRR